MASIKILPLCLASAKGLCAGISSPWRAPELAPVLRPEPNS
jgi:hypothetical protein